MKRTEQLILAWLVVAGIAIGFWVLILGPKRSDASKTAEQVDQLKSSLSQAQQEVADGEKARRSFGVDYRRLVVLGKAVPADDEQASLLVQLQNQASRSGVEFQSIDLSADSSSTTSPPPTTAPPTDSSSTSSTSSDASSADSSSSDSSSSTTTTSSPAPATEAAASMVPIGATVGPAGLPVMAYDLTFTGQFFQIADFMQRVDGMVSMRDGLVDVHGRLLTVNGFSLEPSDQGEGDQAQSLANPVLTAHLNVTTYLTPADQGLTGGATSSGPTLSSSPISDATNPATSSSTSSTTSTDTATSTTP